ncbi:MAG TPA: DegT/DnrJ/EryC1/StrS family aminotransferase [Burkholderiales bacterium]|nr:DegT/DnrJ/EryC1/StrS family aminotransferase [Burkholderiales bacterium]
MSGVAAELHGSASEYWATELPALSPSMLVSRRAGAGSAFPFDAPNVQYVHFARNAIYHLARQWRLDGGEVLMPAYFHGVELEALLAAGARPRFFAVRNGMRVDPEDVIDAITPATRAVYLIHYAGFPGPADAIEAICRARGLLFLEDCALALLSKAGSRPLGSFGDAAVFCLYKTLPTPDGGAVVMKEGRLEFVGVTPNFLGAARTTAAAVLTSLERGGGVMRSMARCVKAVGKAATPRAQAEWVDVGTQHFGTADVDLLMSSVSHRIVAAQDFTAIVEARRRNYLQLRSLLSDLAEPVHAALPDGVCPLFYPFTTGRKLELWTRLRAAGVQAVLFWLGGDHGPRPGEFPDVDVLRRTVLELPCHQDMTAEKIERLARLVRRELAAIG